MKILLKKREYDRCGDYYDTTPTEQPIEGAYQATCGVIETSVIEAEVTSITTDTLEHNGKIYKHRQQTILPNPEIKK